MNASLPSPKVFAQVQPASRAAWREWLSKHGATESGVWLVMWKKSSGQVVQGVSVGYEEAVLEALCFGWIDSKGAALDADRTQLFLTPRKPDSGWSRPNKLRISSLMEAGLMMPAGQALIDSAVANGSWTLLDDVEALVVPADLSDAFDAVPGSFAFWEAFPRSTKRAALEWIVTAKRSQTRAVRVAAVAAAIGRGERPR